MSFGFADVANNVVANGVGSLASRALARVRNIWRRGSQSQFDTAAALSARSALETGMKAAVRQLEAIIDHIMHLDATAGAFHPDKVIVAAQTMRAFKAPVANVRRSGQSSNALHIDFGSNKVVIAGMNLLIQSRLGTYYETYVVQSRDLRADHLCIQPPQYNHALTDPADLVVSFVQVGSLTPLEKDLAVLLDMAIGALDDCYAALNPENGKLTLPHE